MRSRIELFGCEPDAVFRDHLTLALFSHLAQHYGGAQRRRQASGVLASWQLRRVEDWINAHLHEPVSIADLASLVELSASHFARAYAKSTGMPPHRRLLQARIERAKLLLRTSSAPLCEVAAACGFVDQSHFTKVFASIERITPARWRRQLS